MGLPRIQAIADPGKPYRRGRLITYIIHVLPKLDLLLLILNLSFANATKTGYPNEEVNSTRPSASVSVPWLIS